MLFRFGPDEMPGDTSRKAQQNPSVYDQRTLRGIKLHTAVYHHWLETKEGVTWETLPGLMPNIEGQTKCNVVLYSAARRGILRMRVSGKGARQRAQFYPAFDLHGNMLDLGFEPETPPPSPKEVEKIVGLSDEAIKTTLRSAGVTTTGDGVKHGNGTDRESNATGRARSKDARGGSREKGTDHL